MTFIIDALTRPQSLLVIGGLWLAASAVLLAIDRANAKDCVREHVGDQPDPVRQSWFKADGAALIGYGLLIVGSVLIFGAAIFGDFPA